jgi:hypothetical protein
MKIAWKTLMIAALILMKMTAYGASFSAHSAISDTSIPINGNTTLTLMLSFPEGYQPDFAGINERLLSYNGFGEPPFTLIRTHTAPAKKSEEGMTQTITFILRPMTLGKHVIGPNVVTFQNRNGKENVVVPVNAVSIEATDIASTLHFRAMAAPFLDLSPKFPLTVSYSNNVEFIDNAQVIASQTAALAAAAENKEFPWAATLALLICAFVIAIILITPSEPIEVEESQQDRAQRIAAIRSALKDLASQPPRSTDAFLQLEAHLKQLLDSEYHLDTTYDTYQQLSRKIEMIPLPPALKQKLITLFATADKIKFARYQPQKDDYAAASETASQTAMQ